MKVTSKWLEDSGKGNEMRSKGYKLCWVGENKIEEYKLKGLEVHYDYNILNRQKIKYKYGESILMRKK